MSWDLVCITALYRTFDIFSSSALAVAPFVKCLRLSIQKIVGLAVLLSAFKTITSLLAVTGVLSDFFTTMLNILIYIVFFIIGVRASLPKLLFVMLTVMNYGNFVATVSIFLANQFLPGEQEILNYDVRTISITIGFALICFPAFYWLMACKIRPLMTAQDAGTLWQSLWLIPATFCVAYYYVFYAGGGTVAFSLKWKNALFVLAINAGAFFVSYMVVRLVEESASNIQLKTENYQLTMQKVQFETIKNRMDEVLRAKHDLRHHISVLQSCLEESNWLEMQRYLTQLSGNLPGNQAIQYCNQYALNALVVYYQDLATEQGISFEAQVAEMDSFEMAEMDTVILFGNLLENAVEACVRQESGRKFIRLGTYCTGNMLVITVDNSFSGTIQKREDHFLSSKREEEGLGISSIRAIAKKYRGMTRFDYENGIFQASILLNMSTSATKKSNLEPNGSGD